MTRRQLWLGALIAYALILTVIVGMVTLRRGGSDYILEKVGISQPVQIYTRGSNRDLDRFRLYPSATNKIVFLGDSITAQTNWAEYLSDIQNRGIGGNTSVDVLDRVDAISDDRPAKIFLNVGTNDLARGIDPATVSDTIRAIVRRIHAHSRNSKVYVVSILPNNPDLYRSALMRRKAESIRVLNTLLRQSAERNGAQFIDIYRSFTDARGYLRTDLTTDGTHLSERGKALYAASLAPFARERRADR